MAMDLSNQTYQPVNIGSGMSEAFKAGTSVYSDLASNVRALLQTGMGEEGAMRRQNVSDRNAMQREVMGQQGQNMRARISAGYGPTGDAPVMSAEDIANLQKNMAAGTVVKVMGPSGAEYQITGSKYTSAEQLDSRALTMWKEMIKLKKDKGETLTDQEAAQVYWSIRKGLEKETLPPPPPDKKPGFMENLWGGIKGVGSGIGNVLGPSMAFAAGAGSPVQAGTNVAGGVSQYQQLMAEAKRRGLVK